LPAEKCDCPGPVNTEPPQARRSSIHGGEPGMHKAGSPYVFTDVRALPP